MKFISLYLILVGIFFSQLEGSKALPDQNSVFGVWETMRVLEEGENKIARIKIEPCKHDPSKVCGKIVWLEENVDPITGGVRLDNENSDEKLRMRPVMCLQNLWDFERTGTPNEYDSGEIYSTHKGKIYSGSMKLINPYQLQVRGAMLFGLIGRTVVWNRVRNPMEDPCN